MDLSKKLSVQRFGKNIFFLISVDLPIYIFIFVPVWQKNNMCLTPVSQIIEPSAQSSSGFSEAYQWI